MDLDARLIERWRSDDVRPEIIDDRMEWTLVGGAGGRLEVDRFFRDVFED